MVAARAHVERLRRERYYIGRGEQNPLAEDMHQAVNYLSQELYSKDVHFLMELVQNVEDNEYPDVVAPSLEFLVTSLDLVHRQLYSFSTTRRASLHRIFSLFVAWANQRKKETGTWVTLERKVNLCSS
uniref:Uncharacterized protein n=1 Tax=Aegilops tauschii subsp. strangulata TaxID=200361 RepID=A0A453M6P9_AEGTS